MSNKCHHGTEVESEIDQQSWLHSVFAPPPTPSRSRTPFHKDGPVEHRLTAVQKERNFVVVGCSKTLDD